MATLPKENDILYVRIDAGMTCNGGSPVTAGLGGLFVKDNSKAINQGTLYLKGGGLGFVEQDAERTRPFYGTLMAKGPGVVPVTIPSGSAFNVQVQIDGDNGAVIEKRGAGTLALVDGSHHASKNRSGLSSFVIKAGQVAWRPTGSDGNVNPNIQIFPQNHTLVFADDGSAGDTGCSFNIGARDVDMINLTLREEATAAKPKHIFTSLATTNVNLRLTGTPGLNPMGFGGMLTERAGLLWNPTSADNVFVFSNSLSTTKGDLNVSNGTVRLAHGASFSQLNRLALGPGAKFEVESGSGSGFKATELVLADDTAELTVGLAALSFTRATRSGAALADGVYTAATCDWVKGNGSVLVNATLPVQDAWWTNDANHPKVLAANVQTNWYGLHLSGAAFALTAGAGSSVTLGAGGVDTAAAGATYTISWPLLLADSQIWKVGKGDTVSLTTDGLVLAGGAKWCVLNSDHSTLRLDGAKTFPNDLVVSNGWLEARGDESLGGPSGTTTIELQAASWRRGKLRISPEEGKNEVTFHRDVTFHYYKCGEWGSLMTLPENCTVNFYGKMSTSCAGCSGNSWPCHWNYDCPATTTVHWWNTMYAALNHKFPDGTHYIHKPLTGGDRFNVGSGAKVELLAANNSIGASTGSMEGRLICRVPYALDARGADRLLSLVGTLDLDGHDQALSLLHKTSAGGVVTSATEAVLHITRNKTITKTENKVTVVDWNISCTNHNTWVGAAGLSMERTAETYPMVLMATSSSTGTLGVRSGRLVLHAPNGKWPNASAAVVSGGKLVLEHKAALGTNTVMRLSGSGKVEILAGVRVKVPSLVINGVAQEIGTYGSTASGATFPDDTHFDGAGLLRVGKIGACILLR